MIHSVLPLLWIAIVLVPADAVASPDGPRSLLRQARKVAAFEGRDVSWGIAWLSADEVLYIRQSEPLGNTYLKRNLKTGKTTPLPALTKLNPMTTPGYGYRVSPDGNWFLWQNGSGEFEWATLDGRRHFKRKGHGFGLNEFIWRQDSRSWVELGGDAGFSYEDVLIHNALRPDQSTKLAISADSPLNRSRGSKARWATPLEADEAVFTRAGLLRIRRSSQPSSEGGTVEVYDIDLHRQGLPTRNSTIYVGRGVDIIEAAFSPWGDEIAWLLYRDAFHLCVSRLDGSGLRVVGSFKNTPRLAADPDSMLKGEPYYLRWTPGGKSLSFLYDNALWVAPVPSRSRTTTSALPQLLGPTRAAVDAVTDALGQKLQRAARDGELGTVRDLISRGAVTNWDSDLGKSVVESAISRGDEAMVRFLLDAGANLNARDRYGNTPLIHAVNAKNNVIALLLIGRGARPEVRGQGGSTALLQSIRSGASTVVNALLERGANPNVADAEGNLPLAEAAQTGQMRVVEALLSYRAKVDGRDGWNVTALWRAATQGHTEICKVLLKLGADPNVQASARKTNGGTILMVAVHLGNLDLCRLLVARGANVNRRDPAGYSPLSKAVDYGHLEIARFLLDNGADPNIKLIGSTILISAVLKNRTDLVELLLQRGAQVNAMGVYYGSGKRVRKTALGWARAEKLAEVGEILKRAGGRE
jgi:hypothetical protein